ncbi:MAG: aminotransferase class I/II-fold pyridoxal phosphate-dependent enzyme [bacterium]|nr:aminotransferase class I/II-fold pyridoxal phosphate-dependent enzyme [bacterium]
MPIHPAERTRQIRYAVRDIILIADEARRRGRDLLYLNIGDPNPYHFRTPQHILEATIKAMRDNLNGYSPSSGIPEAMSAIRRDAEARGLRAIQDVFIGTGASECIEIALSALVNRGDNVLLPFPGYPLYTALTAKLECEGRPYFLDEANGWQPDLEDLAARIDEQTRAVVLINPNNPTGGTWSREVLLAVIELCRRHGLVLFSDEIYDRLIYNGEQHVPTASLAEDICLLTFNGLSKNWVAPGFRLGWCIVSGPHELLGDYLDAMLKLTRARLCANHPEQHAIRVALEGDQSHIKAMNEVLKRRAQLADRMLNQAEGISLVPPGGAFYAYPRLDITGNDGDFVRELILDTGVVVVPGSGFGQRPGTAHFRLVTLPDDEVLSRAFERIADFTRAWRRR